ncbi:MAG: class I SAM-dependent methyltransferase [Kiritimatiellae bacterium]|nr:class I SAM-dependent methyltransferase [Kiritimatiellia bacterium]MDD5521905.1 class I SAM-dependent methyltransferase [Kiritimatiellia bacterium]
MNKGHREVGVGRDMAVAAIVERIDLCPACHGSESTLKPWAVKHGRAIVKCRRCGLVAVNPQPSEEETRRIYNSEDYFQGSGFTRFGYRDYEGIAEMKRLTFNRWLKILERYVHPDNLLDVGCGTGILMQVAQTRGWRVTGLDISAYAVERTAARGYEVRQGDVVTADFQEASFRVVTMLDVVEHLRDPVRHLGIVSRLLSAGGIVMIVTPDAGSLSARLLGRDWPHVKPMEHLWLFTQRALISLLERAGFEMLWIGRVTKVVTLRGLGTDLRESHPWICAVLRVIQGIAPILTNKALPLPLGEMMALARTRTGT